jgi:NADPH2:quinone reductase
VRAVTIHDGALVVLDRDDPRCGDSELLVRVRAAGINGADLLQLRGGYPPPHGVPVDIPGLELAGEVEAIGAMVTRFAIGDRVMAVVGGGAQAELATVHERHAFLVPKTMSWPEAGGFPEVFTTAHDALFTQCGLSLGEALLVHGAAGGVGTAAVQLGVAAGARVTAAVRNPDARGALEGLGAHAVPHDGFAGMGPYDVILELVGAHNLADNLAALSMGGRVSIVGVGAGARTDIDLRILMAKRARIHGSTLRARSLEDKADAARRVEAHVLPLVADARIRVPVAATFPLSEAAAAYERFAAGSKLGKIVLLA